MKTWLGPIRKFLGGAQARKLLGATTSSAAIGLGAPVAYRSITGEEMPVAAQMAVGGLGGAASFGKLGPAGLAVAGKAAVPLGSLATAHNGQLLFQGHSMLDPKSVKQQANSLIGENIDRAIDKYLPQTALPDGHTARTLSPAASDAVKRLVGGHNVKLSPAAQSVVGSPQAKRIMDGLGFQYSSLHGLTDTAGAATTARVKAYLQGRDRYRVSNLT